MSERFEHESLPGRVIFGAGRVAEARSEAQRLGLERVLLVAGEQTHADLLGPILGPLAVDVIVGAPMHVPIAAAESARARAVAARADGVVAIGGGSATGLAQAIALTTRLPILAVPTTYAGSEMTAIWGLTDRDVKTTGRDPLVLPRTVVYDPDLSRTLPPRLAAASGLNAIAHLVEALWAPGANPLLSAIAEEGVRTLVHALPAVVRDPSDEGARTLALRGAWLGGLALGSAGTALHHKLCHVLGGMGLPHAETHAIVLPYVTAFLAPSAPDAAARLGRALATDAPGTALWLLRETLGLPGALRDVGLDEAQLGRALELGLAAAPAEPRRPDASALERLLRNAFEGAPPASF
ncbi:MAG: maleylacetate reductase [Thermoleophilia bacterium]|nr:maleylacetate reductase [Thermoleophilia bacterium]